MTHRILAVTPNGEYITKGDSNERRDSTPISPGDVVGVGRVLVPIVGLPMVWLREGQLFRFAALVLGAGALLWWSRWAFIDPPSRNDRRSPTTEDNGDEADVVPVQAETPASPVSLDRNRPILALGTVIVVTGLVSGAGLSRAQFSASAGSISNSVTAASSFTTSDFYLHNDPTPPASDTTSHTVLPFDVTAPTASSLYNYDTDRNNDAGILLERTSNGLSETDPAAYQIWSLPGQLDLDGNAELTIWSAIESFRTDKRGVVLVGLLDCASDGSDCNTITTGTLDLDPWNSAATGSWLLKTIDLGNVTHTIAADRTLRIKIVVENASSSDNMWFAYDTTAYESHLHITP